MPQFEQTTEPAAAAYVPAAHAEQILAPAAEKVPASQLLQAEESTDSVLWENDPARQSVQLVAPTPDWKVPATQTAHTAAPAVEYVPAAHARQVGDPKAPRAPENMPAAHSVQMLAPVPLSYAPATHIEQLVWPLVAALVPAAQKMHAPAPEAAT